MAQSASGLDDQRLSTRWVFRGEFFKVILRPFGFDCLLSFEGSSWGFLHSLRDCMVVDWQLRREETGWEEASHSCRKRRWQVTASWVFGSNESTSLRSSFSSSWATSNLSASIAFVLDHCCCRCLLPFLLYQRWGDTGDAIGRTYRAHCTLTGEVRHGFLLSCCW